MKSFDSEQIKRLRWGSDRGAVGGQLAALLGVSSRRTAEVDGNMLTKSFLRTYGTYLKVQKKIMKSFG